LERAIEDLSAAHESKLDDADLALTLADAGRRIRGAFDYSTDLFEGESIERMISHYLCLLRGAAARPERPILDIELDDGA
jgi:non-ribosomal peptide synthetase component F